MPPIPPSGHVSLILHAMTLIGALRVSLRVVSLRVAIRVAVVIRVVVVIRVAAARVIKEGKERGTGADVGRSAQRRPLRKKKPSGTPVTLPALVPSRVMKGHIMTSEIQTEPSVQVVLPNGELKVLRVLVDFGCQAVALANPNVLGDQLSEKNASPQRRRLLQADNETPLPGGDEQIDVKIQFTGVVDGSVSPPCVAQYGVSPYLVPNLPWDMVLRHPWGYEHCVRHFALFNCLYSHHPVHPHFWIEDFREAPRTGKRFLVKPIHGKVSRQSVWGITVPVIGAVTPMHPPPAIVVTPPVGELPNRVEAEKHISYAFFLVHGGCPPASITQKRPNHGQVSVHGEPKFIEGQQPYVQ